MRRRLRSLWLGLALLCFAASAAALSSLDGVQAGWTPLVSWWGGGDPERAVQNLTQLTHAFGAVLHRTDIDAPTRRFMDESLKQLSDFDLHGFHKLLPEERGASRELLVRGDLVGDRYAVRRADARTPFQVSLRGPRRGLADFSQRIRSKVEFRPGDDQSSYLIGVQFGLGVGRLSWDQTVNAVADFGRIVSNADPRPSAPDKPTPSAESIAQVRALHPKLAPEDVEPTALLFDAYPALSRAFSQFGQLEDVRTSEAREGYRHVTVRMRGSPDRLKQKHAPFAKHMARLGKIARIDGRWVDARNRTLMKWVLDSQTLVFTLECYIKDGLLLPTSGKLVHADAGVDPMSDALRHTRAYLQARVQLFGITMTLRQLKLNLSYRPQETYATMKASVNSVPKVSVEGATAGLIDVFIPGNIQSLTEDFFRRAVSGNEGKGITLGVVLGSENREAGGVLEGDVALDALDSRLVKMGVGMVNERVLPSGEVLEDGKKLVAELHDAFMRDLSRYKGRLGS